jgi:hypothetical protein
MRTMDDIDQEHRYWTELAFLGVEGALEKANSLHDEADALWAPIIAEVENLDPEGTGTGTPAS